MADISEQIESAKSTVTDPLPTPPDMEGTQAEPQELLERLNWGEPALTIIDIRDREAFNNERITGALPFPKESLVDAVQGELEFNRDIYLYGATPEDTTATARQLREAGYQKVAEIRGGLSGWKNIGGPTEGVTAFSSPNQ